MAGYHQYHAVEANGKTAPGVKLEGLSKAFAGD